MADSNLMAFRYVKESTWGTTPSSALKNLRITSASFAPVKDVVESGEIIATRDLRDLIVTGKRGEGEFGFELSYDTFDEFFEGILCSTWATDTGLAGAESGTDLLENGTTKSSFTIEQQYTDLTNVFIAYTGWRPGTMNLNLAIGSPINGTISGIAKAATVGSATVGTGSHEAATTTDPMYVTDITLTEGGLALASATSLALTVENGLRAQQALGSDGLRGVGYGGFRASGTLEAYFENTTLLAKALNHTASNIGIVTADAAGNEYEWSIPRIRYGNPTLNNPGPNGDIIASLPFTAILDPTTSKSFRLARTAA